MMKTKRRHLLNDLQIAANQDQVEPLYDLLLQIKAKLKNDIPRFNSIHMLNYLSGLLAIKGNRVVISISKEF